MPEGKHLTLVSASPRRRLLLSAAGYEFAVVTPTVDETPLAGEEPAAMVLRLAEMKTSTVTPDGGVVLGADTTVVLDGTPLGKPQDAEEAVAMLMSLVGRTHSVLTGWMAVGDGTQIFDVAETRVTFHDRDLDEVRTYVDEHNPIDKAGGYGLQGDNGFLVAQVVGSRANVIGLPIGDVSSALTELGVLRSSTHR